MFRCFAGKLSAFVALALIATEMGMGPPVMIKWVRSVGPYQRIAQGQEK